MDKSKLTELIDKVNKGIATDEELGLYNEYINQALAGAEQLDLNGFTNEEVLKRNLLRAINEKIGFQQKKTIRLWPRITAAASIIICLSAGTFFIFHKYPPIHIVRNQGHDIMPGRNQATLTLANGQKIILTKTLNGKLAQQGVTSINVNAGTGLIYSATGMHVGEAQYNTLSTVRGEQSPYVLILADGSKVWLNAASSITFPVAFNGRERKVKITGEAYFEVVHNAAHPFKVEVRGQTIDDIGTAFNINAYEDEPVIKTTLISGSVKVIKNGRSALLKPGEVAITSFNQNAIQIRDVDTEGAMAWKNGYFLFDHENLESILRTVSRWYNVDVKYTDQQAKSTVYLGSITRYSNISKVLKMLEETSDVRFELMGNTLVVKAK